MGYVFLAISSASTHKLKFNVSAKIFGRSGSELRRASGQLDISPYPPLCRVSTQADHRPSRLHIYRVKCLSKSISQPLMQLPVRRRLLSFRIPEAMT
jgi:hypothetical protein